MAAGRGLTFQHTVGSVVEGALALARLCWPPALLAEGGLGGVRLRVGGSEEGGLAVLGQTSHLDFFTTEAWNTRETRASSEKAAFAIMFVSVVYFSFDFIRVRQVRSQSHGSTPSGGSAPT